VNAAAFLGQRLVDMAAIPCQRLVDVAVDHFVDYPVENQA
jgi:hypothetical protein